MSIAGRNTLRCLALAAAVLAACREPLNTPASVTLMSGTDLVRANVSYTAEYYWSSGTATSMGSTTGRICFLTFVRGNFSSTFDYVRIFASSGIWYLGGSTARGGYGIDARARCAEVIGVSAEYTLTSTGSPVTIQLPGSGCGLTGVGGKFDTATDRVQIVPGGSPPDYAERTLVVWAEVGGYVTGRARCASATLELQQAGWTWSEGFEPTQLMTTSGTLCYLTGMRGRFKHASEFVRVWPAYGTWLLGGWSEQGFIHALGGCIQ